MHLRPRFPRHKLPLSPHPPRHSSSLQPWPSTSQSASQTHHAHPSPYHHLRNITRSSPLHLRLRLPQRHYFSTTFHRSAQPTNHYEILGVPPSITQPDLKKRFYVLSKEHHPDLHPEDKSTHIQKFQEISESYSILGDPEKRRRYDRDVLPHFQQYHHGQQGSGAGGPAARGRTYAGSRAPTGLSKRSSAFRGPPPSYWAHGGGGSYDPGVNPHAGQYSSSSAKGQQAYQEEYTGAYHPQGTANGADFDSQGVFKTQTHEDSRRNARRAAAMAAAQQAAEAEGDVWARFVAVSCVLLAGVSLGSLLIGRMNGPGGGNGRGGLVRGDGTRRELKKG